MDLYQALASLYGLKYLSKLRESSRYYVDWLERADTLRRGQTVLGLTRYEHFEEPMSSFTFVRTYPLVSDFGRYRGVMSVEIHESYVRQMLCDLVAEEEILMLVDERGILLSGTLEFEAGQTLMELDMSQQQILAVAGSSVLDDTRNSGSYYACSPALPNGWRLVKRIPAAALYNVIGHMQRLLIAVSGLTLLIGLAAALLFSRRIYNPLRSLTELLRSMMPIREFTNEYQLIGHSIHNLNERISSLRLRLDTHLPLLKNNLVISIMDNTLCDRETFARQMELIEMPLSPGDSYQVLVLQISRALTRELDQKNLQLIKLHLIEQMERLCQDRTGLLTGQTGERRITAVLVGRAEVFAAILEEMARFLTKHYIRMACLAAGPVCDDYMALPAGYQEACKTIRQVFFCPDPNCPAVFCRRAFSARAGSAGGTDTTAGLGRRDGRGLPGIAADMHRAAKPAGG